MRFVVYVTYGLYYLIDEARAVKQSARSKGFELSKTKS